jgi:4-hydroxyphenylpyruvate dioxygenase-like putative hemolysin
LPGFEQSIEKVPQENGHEHGQVWKRKTFGVDHVTYVVECGDSDRVLNWYSKVFGMTRFIVGPAESVDEGLDLTFSRFLIKG